MLTSAILTFCIKLVNKKRRKQEFLRWACNYKYVKNTTLYFVILDYAGYYSIYFLFCNKKAPKASEGASYKDTFAMKKSLTSAYVLHIFP